MIALYHDKLSLFTLYQTQKLRLAVSNLFHLQCVVLKPISIAILIFVKGIRLIGFRL